MGILREAEMGGRGFGDGRGVGEEESNDVTTERV
jgi:hypothetical protein